MSMITISIELPEASDVRGANFRAEDLVWILDQISVRLRQGYDDEIIRDINGNRIGSIAYENWSFEE
jgi:hypothetical protein